LPTPDADRREYHRQMQIVALQPGPQVDEFYQEVLEPSFPREELCTLEQLRSTVEGQHTTWVAVDAGRVIGGLVGEWDATVRVMTLCWLATKPGTRGGGVGGTLLETALQVWRREFAPCLVLAEVEDPARHTGSEATGDPAARLRFYQRRGARALDMPYFQASLGEGLARVPGLLLMVLHADAQFAGAAPDTIDPEVIRAYLESYQLECEGQVGTDEQANEIWQVLDAHPDGVPLVTR
jgi:GNAT superfamily N-acetyltransferase